MIRQFVFSLFACSVCFISSTSDARAETKFPYHASVISPQVEVRCGPGSRFYVTGHLKEQQTVTVHRHDHGGWYMIAPPPGSFSWINANHVKKVTDQRGIVEVPDVDGVPARAMVRMGSQVSNDSSYFGRELRNGDEVQILGEQTLTTQRGPVKMYKIVPPRQEFRWMKGEFLVPQGQQNRAELAVNPYEVPPEHRKRVAEEKVVKAEASEKRKALAARRARDFQHLDEIDNQYSQMMARPPMNWDLDTVESEYRALKSQADSAVAKTIDQRLDVIKRRREILAHYQNFVRVAAETSKRDSELSAMQTLATQTSYENISSDGSVPIITTEQIQSPQFQVQGPQLPPGSPAMPTETNPIAPRLNGAGIIRTMNTVTGPRLVLTAPNGRFLAHLEVGRGVDMKPWIGKQAGLIGHRAFEPSMGTDVIKVRQVVPVQLIDR